MKIQVKQEHIELGCTNHKFSCPIALACADAGLVEPEIHFIRMGYWKTKNFGFTYALLPQEATNFIQDFDDGKPVRPFEFELPIEQP